jgi:hypothetical protein
MNIGVEAHRWPIPHESPQGRSVRNAPGGSGPAALVYEDIRGLHSDGNEIVRDLATTSSIDVAPGAPEQLILIPTNPTR